MNGSISMSHWLTALICFGLLISRSAADIGEESTQANLTATEIERLYNDVLTSSINSCRQKLQNSNNSHSIDKEYFEMLDKANKENYYSTAYLIFSLIHDDWFKGNQSDEVLQQLIPEEKVSIRQFFSQTRWALVKYFKATHQTSHVILDYVSRWQTENADSIIEAYLEFPRKLREAVPELHLIDYTAQEKIIMDAVVQAIQNALHSLLTPRKSLEDSNIRLRAQ